MWKPYHILNSRAIGTGASAPVVGSTGWEGSWGEEWGSVTPSTCPFPRPRPGPSVITPFSFCAFQVFDDFVIHAYPSCPGIARDHWLGKLVCINIGKLRFQRLLLGQCSRLKTVQICMLGPWMLSLTAKRWFMTWHKLFMLPALYFLTSKNNQMASVSGSWPGWGNT